MNFSDHDLERWLRAACPPVEPAPPLRRRVLAAAPKPKKAGRVLRLLVPFAAGALSVFGADRLSATPASDTNVSDTIVSEGARGTGAPLPAGVFERIADRAPPPAPAREESVPAPQRPVELASAPVPRIS